MHEYYFYDGRFYTANELKHYGVKGQKWGVRRYQNADGSLTDAGKKRARQEVKADNKTAYELGKQATIYGHAAARSLKRTIKLEQKLDKQYTNDPDGVKRKTQRLYNKLQASTASTASLMDNYEMYRSKAESHCKSLVEKYGDDAIDPIKYKDLKLPKDDRSPSSFTTMNERTVNLGDFAKAGVASVATSAAMQTLMGLPVAILIRPQSTAEKAHSLEYASYRANLDISKGSSKTARLKEYESTSEPVTSVDKALKSKTPYYALSERERISVDRSYQDRRRALLNKYNAATSDSERQKIMDQADDLELDYLEIIERDW